MDEVKRFQWSVSAMFALNGGLFGAWASRIPEVQHFFDLSPKVLGFYLLALAGGAITAFPLAGKLCDRFGAARTTRAIAVLYCPTLVLIALSGSLWMLAISIFLFGAAHGAMDVAMNGWGAEVERARGRSIMSMFHAMFSLGAGIGAAGGAFAAWMSIDYSTHFIVFAVLSAGLLVFARGHWQSQTTPAGERKAGIALPRGGLLVVAVIAFSTALSEGAVADWSAVFLTSVVDASASEAALGFATFSCTMVIMRLLGDRIITAIGALLTVRLCSLTAFAGSLVVVTGTTPLVVCIGFAFMGIGYSIIMPLVFSRAANDSRLSSGAAIAGVATFGYGGMLLGPPFIGFLAQATSLQLAFHVFVLLAAVAFVGAAAFRKSDERINA